MAIRIENKIPETVIRQELDRILQSPIFAQSDRLARFLRYTVEHAIKANDEPLKEFIIGTDVYDRKPPYHPSLDSIVRTEARRLRMKLKEYYESEGHDDSIFIYFRLGNYVPVFRRKEPDASYQVGASKFAEDSGSLPDVLFTDGAGVSIAVIPFLDVSGQPLSSKYARGVTDELIHELMRCEGCRVVSVSSVTHFGALSADIPGLARRLGVQVVFEGTVREEGNLIRVTARIVNADGFQLWSQRFDAEADPSSLFAVQEQFASALVNRVRPQQSSVRAAKASISAIVLTVITDIFRGEALIEEGTVADINAALAKFNEVTQSTPLYARPYCGLTQCNMWLALHGAVESRELIAQARSSAQRALEIDPQMIEAIAGMASVEALEWNWSSAEARFHKAVQSGPNVIADQQFSMLLTSLGRFDEAWLYLERAQQVDPFSYLQKVACARFFDISRRREEALAYFAEPIRYGPVPLEARLYLALIHAQLENYVDARIIVQQSQRTVGAKLPLCAWIAELHAYCADRPLAEAAAEAYGLRSPDLQMSKYRQALLAVAFGNNDEALSLLLNSYANRDAELPFLAVDPRFDPIRESSQFSELVAKVRSFKAS